MVRTSKSQRFFRLALFSALFSLLLVVLAAWGRINEAGVGCPGGAGVFGRVFAQIILGILTVRLQHKPLISMLHLSAGLSILGLLWWVVLREHRFWRPATTVSAGGVVWFRAPALVGLLPGVRSVAR